MTDRVHTAARRTAVVLVTLLLAAVIPGIGPLGHIGRAHAVLSNGLVAYWPLDEGSGPTSADLTGDGNTLTLGSTNGWTSSTAPLRASNPSALTFAGDANSVATAPGTDTDNATALTVAFWVRLDPPATVDQTFFSLPGKLSIGYSTGAGGTFIGFTRVFPSSSITLFANASSFAAGGWHHVAMTVDPSGTAAYVDGVQQNSIPGGFGRPGNGIHLGDAAQPLAGAMDEVRIYNRALTATQVAPLAEPVSCANVTGIPLSECNALQALYDNTGGFDWTHLDGWFTSTNACTWYGVFCDTDTGHVVGLSLPNNNLVGAFPTGLGALAHLVVLDLSGNQLSDSIPIDLGGLSALQTLTLSRNRLTGPIPVNLGQLSALHFLNLDDNALSGTIPSQLANLSALIILNLFDNGLAAADPTLVAFLNAEEPNWAATQTIAPSNVAAAQLSPSSIGVSWTPIAYTGDGGYYDVLVKPQSGSVFTSVGHTADKSANGFTITGLVPGESYVVSVRSFTPAHGNQGNDIVSVGSDPIAPTPGAAPTITLQPADTTVASGQTATFTAAADGTPTPTVQWQVSTNGTTFTDIPTATTTTLSFTVANGDDGKQYRAVFTNGFASTPTSAAMLTIPATSYTSHYGPDEYRFLFIDARFFHRGDLAGTQHDAAMFLAYLGGLAESGGQPVPNLGSQPGSGPLAVTTTYNPADTAAIQHAAMLFSSDPATVQRIGVDLLAYLLLLSGHH